MKTMKTTAIITAALLTISLAACDNSSNTTNTDNNTANTTSKETKNQKPKEKLNPGNWNAWDIKVKPIKTEADSSGNGTVNKYMEISITNKSDEEVYAPYFEIDFVTPANGDDSGADILPGSDPLNVHIVVDGQSPYDISRNATVDDADKLEAFAAKQNGMMINWKPGDTKKIQVVTNSATDDNDAAEVKDINFSSLKIAKTAEEYKDLTEGDKIGMDAWDSKYCPGKNEDGTEQKTDDQCTEKWGPVFEIATGKKITDYATGKNQSTVYFEDMRPDDDSDWKAKMTDEEMEQWKMQNEFLNGNK